MKNPPGQQPPTTEQLYPDRTFTDVWREQVGDEWVRAKYYGVAHTSGDAVITFERANVAHMGDLMFHQRHPVIDKAAGASIKNWISVLEKAAADHDNDTIYIFGHANTGLPVTGPRAALMAFRDYLTGAPRVRRRAGQGRQVARRDSRDPGSAAGLRRLGPAAREARAARCTVLSCRGSDRQVS